MMSIISCIDSYYVITVNLAYNTDEYIMCIICALN